MTKTTAVESRETPMRMITTTVSLAALCTTLLVGCGSNESSEDAKEETWRPDASVPTAPGPDGFTPPDAVLSPGNAANVPLLDEGMMDDPDVTGTLEVTVLESEAGDRADLPTDMGVGDDAEGTPHYVRFSVKNTGKDAITGDVLIRLAALDSEGETLTTWASSGFSTCPGALPSTFAPGQSADLCSVVFVEDVDLAAVGYDAAPDYDDHAVLWDLT